MRCSEISFSTNLGFTTLLWLPKKLNHFTTKCISVNTKILHFELFPVLTDRFAQMLYNFSHISTMLQNRGFQPVGCRDPKVGRETYPSQWRGVKVKVGTSIAQLHIETMCFSLHPEHLLECISKSLEVENPCFRNTNMSFFFFFLIPIPTGHPVDAESSGHQLSARLRRVEGEVRREGPGLLLAAQPVPAQHPRAARGDAQAAHLHGVPKQLPVVAGPHRGRIQLQEEVASAPPDAQMFNRLLFLTNLCFFFSPHSSSSDPYTIDITFLPHFLYEILFLFHTYP